MVHYAKPVCPTALKLLPDGTLCEAPAGLVCLRSHCVGMAEWLRDQPRYALIRAGLRRAERVLACSRWMAEQLRVNGIAAEPIALPVPPPEPAYRRAPSREPVFLYCGRLNWEKGVDLLLHAFARLLPRHPTVRLRILGGGPRQSVLEGLADRLGIDKSVSFEGRVPFDQVETALGQAWALLAPSIWPEPLGLTAIEAITRGVPAIASAGGGLAETVEDGVSGSLVPNGDEGALAECLMAAVNRGPRVVPEDVADALRIRHDPVRHGAALTTIFREAIARRPGSWS
jgi:glycosyltransferase involved in cell wall biosynthesis